MFGGAELKLKRVPRPPRILASGHCGCLIERHGRAVSGGIDQSELPTHEGCDGGKRGPHSGHGCDHCAPPYIARAARSVYAGAGRTIRR